MGRIYLDTNITANCFMCGENVGTDKQISLSQKFLDECIKNNHIVIISTIVLSELATVSQKAVMNRPEITKMEKPDEAIRYIDRNRADLYAGVLHDLAMIPNVEFVDTEQYDSPCLFDTAIEIMLRVGVSYRKNRLKRFEPFDALHLALARRIGCMGFYTLDRMFGNAALGADLVHVLDPDRPDAALSLV